MLISEFKELLKVKLFGDNGEFILDKNILKIALLEVLRRTKPRTHLILEKSDFYLFKHFRQIDKEYYLRYPYIDLDDNANLDMEEELCMAVLFFVCAYASKDKFDYYVRQAENIIAIYDTNITYTKLPRFLNLYFSKKDKTNTQNINIPILKYLVIPLGDTEKVLINTNSNNVKATSLNKEIFCEIKGDYLEITPLEKIEQGYVLVESEDEKYKIEIFADESSGGIL